MMKELQKIKDNQTIIENYNWDNLEENQYNLSYIRNIVDEQIKLLEKIKPQCIKMIDMINRLSPYE